MIDTYFIYVHRRDDTNEVFYVGKGTRTQTKQYSRAYVTTKAEPLLEKHHISDNVHR